jgi:ubiquinone/menaquinone biosynthesis C-methylase UbiE
MPEGILPDYSRQSQTYDSTRGASAIVVAAILEAIEGAPGSRLADIGGGTGNYALPLARRGWRPLVVDRSPEMLEHADGKGLETLLADAQELPLDDESFDAVLVISMLHHVDDPRAVLAEAKRVLRPGGRLALKMFSREDVEGLWLYGYFPASRGWMIETHPSSAEFEAVLPGARKSRLVLNDLSDASMAALTGCPDLILEQHCRRQTSYFERMERDHPEELASGLQRLAEDLEAGQVPRGDGGSATFIAWHKPTPGVAPG